MRKFIVLAMCILVCFAQSFAQKFELKGLEIYNPAYSNPAFTSSDKFVQTDLIAYDLKYYNGYWFNAMSSLPNSNSSIGVSVAGSKYYRNYSSIQRDRSEENIVYRGNRYRISYAYTHTFTDQFKLSGGINYVHSIMNVSDTTTNLISRNTGFVNTGLKLSYRKLYAGISAGIGLYARNKQLNEANMSEVTWEKMNTFSSSFIAGYSLGGERRVNFDPLIGYYFAKDLDTDFSEFGFYAGGTLSLLHIVGVGFTVGDQFSISTSISFPKRASLIVGLYQTEGSFNDYGLGVEPLSFIAQLRIKL